MSFFLSSIDDHIPVNQEKLNMASIQFEAMNQSFNTMLYTCLEKCISKEGYGEGELTKGEATCVDRCIAKIHYSNRHIGAYLQTQPASQPHNILKHYTEILNKLEKQCGPVNKP